MALGPQHYRAVRESLCRAAEDRIDAAISRSTRTPITVQFALLGIELADWRDVLSPKYLAAGWGRAEFVSDQRDGSFIILE